MTLYNGTAGIPKTTLHSKTFYSPWTFNPQTGTWTLHQNRNHYTEKVAEKAMIPVME